MANSEQIPPAQAQPSPIMRCCQKTNIRDCDCLRPQGSCQQPENILTHYHHQCPCYSCEWVREARQQTVPNHLVSGSKSSHNLENSTYAGKKLDEVFNTRTPCLNTEIPRSRNGLELVYPILAAEGPPQEWQWAYRPTNQRQLPYLANRFKCPRSVKMVTLDSHGNWKGIRRDMEPVPLFHDRPPKSNRLYRDYGYSPVYSPYQYSLTEARDPDRMACTPDPLVPANVLRRRAADETNTTLVVGSIDESVSNKDLLLLFGLYGQIRYLNRPDQTCAFIQFALRRDAMMAMRQLQGIPIYTNRFRISWGDPRVKNQDEFEAKEGPLRLKGHRHQKPEQPKDMEKERKKACWLQQPLIHPRHGQRLPCNLGGNCGGNFGGNPVYQYVPPHGQEHAQQQMRFGNRHTVPPQLPGFEPLPPIDEAVEPKSDQTKPPVKLDPKAASWYPDREGKGRAVVVVSSDMVSHPSEQAHRQPPQDSGANSLESQPTTKAESNSSGSNAATDGSSTEGRTSPEEEASPDEEASYNKGRRCLSTDF